MFFPMSDVYFSRCVVFNATTRGQIKLHAVQHRVKFDFIIFISRQSSIFVFIAIFEVITVLINHFLMITGSREDQLQNSIQVNIMIMVFIEDFNWRRQMHFATLNQMLFLLEADLMISI